MLGRIPTGSAVAALPLALLIAAVSWESCPLGLASGAVLALTLVWTFAPWIPGLKDRLPARRRVKQLEAAWADGQVLVVRGLQSMAQFDEWQQAVTAWEDETRDWIEEGLSGVEALRFFNPHRGDYSLSLRLEDSLNTAHHQARNRIVHQLDELIRLRDEQERTLH